MSLLPFFEWLENLAISTVIRESIWAAAIINVMHLLALVILAGAILMVDLRLLGRGVSAQPLAQVAREARPWLIGALLAMLLTGLPQVLSTAIKQYYSPFFWTKMEILAIAVLFTFTVRQRIALADEGRVRPIWRKAVALVSMALWTGVAIEGRLIGLLS
jgi:hypothetical protein